MEYSSWPWLFLSVLIAWKLLCIWLRRQRALFLAQLDPIKDAHKLMWAAAYVEFPYITNRALQFALFKTYGIPSVSSVLQQTGQLVRSGAKRADDTDILIQEFLLHHVDSDRGSYALRRMNFIHGHYKISNDDYLYTLSLFVLEAPAWASRYAQREWTEAEKLATFVVWHDIGVRMGIQNIPSTLEALAKFQEDYEIKHMVYAESNRVVADGTVELLLDSLPVPVPAQLRPIARRAVYALLDDRLRESFGYPKQPLLLQIVLKALLWLVTGTLVSMFMPPRPLSMACTRIPVDNSHNPRCDPHRSYLLSGHVYKPVPYPNGYKLSQLGPFMPGKIGRAHDGKLLCPLWSRSSIRFAPSQ